MRSGFLVHRNTRLHLHAHTQVNICPQGTYHCFSGLQYAENVRECIFQMMLRQDVQICSHRFMMRPLSLTLTLQYSFLHTQNQHKTEKI